jgi:archaemetzincin
MKFPKATGTSQAGSHLTLGLAPLHPVELEISHDLCPALADFFSLNVEILAPQYLPLNAYSLGRQQYHATEILEYLLNDHDKKPWRLLGITGVDLYIPIFTYVFGEAQLDGRCAVISSFRLGGGATVNKAPPEVLGERLIKLGVHELGHTFGLPHCRQETCLMNFAPTVEKLDLKNMELCEYCRVLLDDYFKGLSHP